jgi:hypothetical protein
MLILNFGIANLEYNLVTIFYLLFQVQILRENSFFYKISSSSLIFTKL